MHGHAALPGPGDEVTDRVDLVGLDARGPDVVALGAQEGEAHRPADRDRVDAAEQVLEHGQLVGDLGPAEHGHVGPGGVLEQATEDLDLAFEQQARVAGQAGRDAADRGVATVAGPEGVVDVDVGHGRQGVGEAVLVGLLAGIEPQVLEQHDLAVAERVGTGARVVADHVGRDGDVLTEQLGQAGPDRAHRVGRVDLAVGSTEVRGQHDPRPAVEQQAQGRQCRLQPQVVGDPPRVQRDVEVGTQEDPRAGRVEVTDAADTVEQSHGGPPVRGGGVGVAYRRSPT